MYKTAYSQDGGTVFYLDSAGNKYAASGGSLAWRLNNPGLVHNASRFFSRQGSIGHFGHYAIFATPENGREALSNWLHSKKYFNGSLKTIAKHYQSSNPDDFAGRLSTLTDIPIKTKIKALSKQEFSQLLFGIEKLCNYRLHGDEKFHFMPKILGKIESGENEDTYLIGGNVILSKAEAIQWVQQNRLDAIIVHEHNGHIHLRSRPDHWIQHIRVPFAIVPQPQDIAPFMRIVGTAKEGQCIWAFINGIDNTKQDALKAANRISSMAGGERVLAMQNDTKGFKGSVDFGDCILLKASLELPVIQGLTDDQMIREWSFQDAILELDSIDAEVIKKFAEARDKHYHDMFSKINNLTILDPDAGSRWKHEFASDCYQRELQN